MAITISPSFSQDAEGADVLSDFTVDHHEELFHGLAPNGVWQDEATGEYVYDMPHEPGQYECWDYSNLDFSSHPILGDTSSSQEVALYWLDHSSGITEAELSAMLDGLESYEGIEREKNEALIAFKCGDLAFNQRPIDLQQELIEASGYIVETETESPEDIEQQQFDAFAELTTATPEPELADFFGSIAEGTYDSELALLASLSSRFHSGEDPEALIEEAVSMLGMDAALSAYHRFNEYLTNNDH
jgi:hypothetical protein